MNINKLKENKTFRAVTLVFLSFFAAVAFTLDFIDFTARYDFSTTALIPVFYMFFSYVQGKNIKNNPWIMVCAIGTAFFTLIGKVFYLANSSVLLWGSKLRLIYFLIGLIGYSYIFYNLYLLLFQLLIGLETPKPISSKVEQFFFGKFCMLKLMGCMLLVWLPIIILCYPGGICGDSVAQIRQAIGLTRYNNIHPLTHTFFIYFFLRIGDGILGSYNRGLYLQILVQCLIMSSVMAYSLKTLYKRDVSRRFVLFLLGLFCFTPFYANFATMTVKDSLFNTWILLFFTYLVQFIYEDREKLTAKRAIQIILSGLGIMLFRNNGPIVFACSAIGLCICFFKNKKTSYRDKICKIMLLCVLPVIIYAATNWFYINVVGAEKINGKEILSIPFQQTARYLTRYKDEVTVDEWEAIGLVLDTNMQLDVLYDPNISDPLKRVYVETATSKDVAAYLIVWAKMFFKHPGVYVEAFLNMIYGWFDPGVNNFIRYNSEVTILYPPRWGDNTETVNEIFNFLYTNPITALLDTVAVYVWWMFLLIIRLAQKKDGTKIWVFMFPLIISLVVCMASPCCLLHPRYALPIVFTVPFLTGYLLKCNRNEDE